MHALQTPCRGKVGQIAADGLHADSKARGKIINRDAACRIGKSEDVGVAQILRNRLSLFVRFWQE